jgi:hypothetical protein
VLPRAGSTGGVESKVIGAGGVVVGGVVVGSVVGGVVVGSVLGGAVVGSVEGSVLGSVLGPPLGWVSGAVEGMAGLEESAGADGDGTASVLVATAGT